MTDMMFTGAIVESSDNVVYTDNVKKSLSLFQQVDGFVTNLETDYDGVQTYLERLQVMKQRGFKCDNSITRLEFQLQQTKVSIDSLSLQKRNRLRLLATDIIELSAGVLNKRLVIDDKEQVRIDEFHSELSEFKAKVDICAEDINRIISISLNHMRDLFADIGKFDAQIEEAKVYATRNYDIGDLVGDLEMQKHGLKQGYESYISKFAQLSVRHHSRTEKYIEDIKKEAEKMF